jgi:hypothetical protein
MSGKTIKAFGKQCDHGEVAAHQGRVGITEVKKAAPSQFPQVDLENSLQPFGELAKHSARSRVRIGESLDVPKQKPISGRALEQRMQKNPEIIEGHTLKVRRLQHLSRVSLKRVEQRLNDLFLSSEMVVEITRADIHLVGDFIGCRSGFAFFVEQQQAGDQYSVSGISTHFPTMGQKAC